MSSSATHKVSPRSKATRPPRRQKPLGEAVRALPWVGPALLLIIGVVFFPAGYMIFVSTREVSQYGVDRGAAGFANYAELFALPQLPGVLLRTAIWVIAVVGLTVLISLALAQFLNKQFPGRRIVRMFVIVPWAASVVMTTTVFYYGLDPFYGIINKMMVDIGLLDSSYGFTKNVVSAFTVAILIAVFVSLPFTTYTILAGLQTVSAEVIEAARMDGARPWKIYTSIVLPQLRGALAVAVLINIINVFNSLPILKIMTGSIPGYDADTIMTLIFKLLQVNQRLDLASALSVVAFGTVIFIVALYVWIVKPMKETDE
ncbi:sugar ABC transporter permease [Lysinibacter sp. HNR]|uniref:carbohydrate ABC transporter permease n=1 Tax=Lysinibacter sp. HNR TaxID=3031408 RepID=UPI002435C196|nr:sugar ABC transporter permease [Lysinibacter sp. HNR]WGD38034.1 sugar ABC transporter permease [Lysinibacter sp. HNR]